MIDAQEGTDRYVPLDQLKGWGPVQEYATRVYCSEARYEMSAAQQEIERERNRAWDRMDRFYRDLEVNGRTSQRSDWK